MEAKYFKKILDAKTKEEIILYRTEIDSGRASIAGCIAKIDEIEAYKVLSFKENRSRQRMSMKRQLLFNELKITEHILTIFNLLSSAT